MGLVCDGLSQCSGISGSDEKTEILISQVAILSKQVQGLQDEIKQQNKSIKQIPTKKQIFVPPPPPPPPPPTLPSFSQPKSNPVQPPPPKQSTIFPFFTNLGLSQSDFDSQYDYQFKDGLDNGKILQRGGFPYFPPVIGKKYALNVSLFDLFDGSSIWNGKTNQKGQWAMGYHGLKHPLKSLKSIIDGRLNGEMLIPGKKQSLKDILCINSKNYGPLGQGVYIYPHLEEALLNHTKYATFGNQSYHIVLQCRLKPDKIRIPKKKEDHWVVKQSLDIRPTAILLYTQKQWKQIYDYVNKGRTIHKRFQWKDYAQKYKIFASK